MARTGNTWTGDVDGVLADGRTGAQDALKFVDDKTFVYESTDREVDGQPIADASMKYIKKSN